jgi:hypothetical protein
MIDVEQSCIGKISLGDKLFQKRKKKIKVNLPIKGL